MQVQYWSGTIFIPFMRYMTAMEENAVTTSLLPKTGIFTHRDELKMAVLCSQIPAMFFHKRPPLLEHHTVENVCCVGAHKQPRCQDSAAKPSVIKANRNACDFQTRFCISLTLDSRVLRRACEENINDAHIKPFVPVLRMPHVDC